MNNIFTTPGNADNLSEELLEKWNQVIKNNYDSLIRSYPSEYFEFAPADISNASTVSIKWFGDPAEPAFCLSKEIAQKLSDWGIRGRHNTHNEYCEYSVTYGFDSQGRRRPKRVQVTTELREYWVTLAIHSPDKLAEISSQVLNREVSFLELYGVNDPISLSLREREVKFSRIVAGHGNDSSLADIGVPSQPEGDINRENVLFMTHPINGLDDLIYIVLFGAQPYAIQKNGNITAADKESIFKQFNVTQLACRHADPAAAMGAHGAAFNGQKVAFTENLGMYIHSFASNRYLYNDEAIPSEWIKFSRGEQGMYQRLEFGPSDSEDVFLDDITVAEGGEDIPVTGGYQIVKNIEVGPYVHVGEPKPMSDSDYVIINENLDGINCSEANICKLMQRLYSEYSNSNNKTNNRLNRQIV
jgi:hypothetical protein